MAKTAVQLAVVAIGICSCFELVQSKFINAGVKYRITFNVFSGLEDPEWEIDDKSPFYNHIASMVNSDPPSALDDGLGYQGFTVQAINFMGQTAWKTIGEYTNEPLESELLRSIPRNSGISNEVMNNAYSGIHGMFKKNNRNNNQQGQQVIVVTNSNNEDDDDSNNDFRYKILGRKKRRAFRPNNSCSTRFEPQKWNFPPVQRQNNCYNYATNRRTNTFAQPGRGSGRKYNNINSQEVYQAVLRDGLTSLSGPNAGSECLIALVIWPGQDFHFYRLDENNMWSHKSGGTLARNTDESGMLIPDVLKADRGPYKVFAGWLGVGKNINIK